MLFHHGAFMVKLKRVFFVAGIPRAMPRIKAFSRGGFTSVYTPKGPWQDWAARIKLVCGGAPAQPFEGAVALSMFFWMPEPKGLRESERGGPHRKRPDGDNLAKLVMDRLQERGWFKDDGQVFDLHVVKTYNDSPGLTLTIELHDDTLEGPGSE
jgi:Holliday junction resolvase RusA-like endonuclease